MDNSDRLRAATVIAFVLTAAVTGIIGNSLYDLIPYILKYMMETTTVSRWIFAVVSSILLPPIPILMLRHRDGSEIAATLIELDEWILLSIGTLYTTEDRNQVVSFCKNMCRRAFQKILSVRRFRNCGLAIYLPDPEGQTLRTWLAAGSPNEVDPSLSFFIGDGIGTFNPTGGQGVAGQTYLDGETRVVHMNDDRESAKDCVFYFRSPMGTVSYRSFISVAISRGRDAANGGVLCIYSTDYKIFNSRAVVALVEAIAQRLSSVIEACYE